MNPRSTADSAAALLLPQLCVLGAVHTYYTYHYLRRHCETVAVDAAASSGNIPSASNIPGDMVYNRLLDN